MARVMTEIAHLMNDGDLELGTRAEGILHN